MFVHTGEYTKHVNGDMLKSTYYTFTPRSLLNRDFDTMDDELAALLIAAYRTIGMLEGMALFITHKEHF
jgi:hypothetical protein